MRSTGPIATLVSACFSLSILLTSQPVAAQGEYEDCVFHTWAVGSRLGWAEALARYGTSNEDATLIEHVRTAGLHVERAHALCAQNPPPWPAWPNWSQIQGQFSQLVDRFRSGAMTREQLVQAIRSSQQSLASQLAYRALGNQIERAPTCAEHYVRIGADLAFAQTTGQSLRRLPPDATDRLGEARSLISAMRNFRPPCHDFTSLLPGIDLALRDPGDARIVQLLDDTWSRGGQIAAPPGAIADPQQQNSPTAGLVVNGEYVDCVFHTWATGSQLGWAEALARHGSPSEDARMLEHMRVAGLHVERAHALCAQNPPPWPAWQDWRAIQSQITQLSDQFRRGLMNRAQLATALAALHQSLASQLAYRVLGTQIERAPTCAEHYVRIGAALGFAHTTTQISGRLTPDAAEHLQLARSLIQEMRGLRPPCRDFTGLLTLIDDALNRPSDASIVQRVNGIWDAGALAVAIPGTGPWPPTPPPPPPPPTAHSTIEVSGSVDRQPADKVNANPAPNAARMTLQSGAITVRFIFEPSPPDAPTGGRVEISPKTVSLTYVYDYRHPHPSELVDRTDSSCRLTGGRFTANAKGELQSALIGSWSCDTRSTRNGVGPPMQTTTGPLSLIMLPGGKEFTLRFVNGPQFAEWRLR
jgi:plasmid stabilization system protein ParE